MKQYIFLLLAFVFTTATLHAQLTTKEKGEITDSVASILERKYVFPELAQQFTIYLRKQLSQIRYDTITSPETFAAFVTADMQQHIKDKHLRLKYHSETLPNQAILSNDRNEEQEKVMAQWLLRENYGITAVKVLPGNIGYIDFKFFCDPEYAGNSYVAIMNYVANTDALIIDLRNCNGSMSPDAIPLLCSYFFHDATHLNDFYLREGNVTAQSWTSKIVQGKKYLNKPIYILTSGKTFSGAEELAYDLQNLKRATIIGEVTGGGANPGMTVRVKNQYSLFVPFGRAINPITKTNWEGVGVTPDKLIKSNLALYKAQMMALEYLVNRYKDDAKWKKYLEGQQEQIQKELQARSKHTFILAGFENAKEVYVVGSFNNWSPNSDMLKRKEGVWFIEVEAEPGKHTYKFIVDGRWILDPNNPEKLREGEFENSVVMIN